MKPTNDVKTVDKELYHQVFLSKERANELKRQAKENWLIAWSAIRAKDRYQSDPFAREYLPRLTKEVKQILPLAKKCRYAEQDMLGFEDFFRETLAARLHDFVKSKGYKKEWTGYKWTWVKIEKPDVPF